MCKRSDGVNVTVSAFGDDWELRGTRHWCKPRTLEEAKALTQELLWGIAAGVLVHIPSGEPFNLRVTIMNAEFYPGDNFVWEELPEGHPLLVHLGVLKWGSKPRGPKGGD